MGSAGTTNVAIAGPIRPDDEVGRPSDLLSSFGEKPLDDPKTARGPHAFHLSLNLARHSTPSAEPLPGVKSASIVDDVPLQDADRDAAEQVAALIPGLVT